MVLVFFIAPNHKLRKSGKRQVAKSLQPGQVMEIFSFSKTIFKNDKETDSLSASSSTIIKLLVKFEDPEIDALEAFREVNRLPTQK